MVGYCTAMATRILSIDDLPAAEGVRARLEPVGDLDRLGATWCALEPHSEPSFFRSWGWIGCWLRHLPPGRQPLAAIATKGAEIVGLGVFVPVRRRRHWLAPARTLRLHESGEPALDSPFIEHNGLVAKGAHASAVWAAMLGLFGRGGAWDEVVLGGMEGHTAEASIEAARAQGCPVMMRAYRRAAHLELSALRLLRASVGGRAQPQHPSPIDAHAPAVWGDRSSNAARRALRR
jgi:hypothetical protein